MGWSIDPGPPTAGRFLAFFIDFYEEQDIKCKWQMIFGVETHPDYQHQRIATSLLNSFIDIARSQNRLGLVLTCKKELVGFYSQFGFVNEGVSVSSHGGVVWYQMRLEF